MSSFAYLVLRATVGTLIMGHGMQKLFGWFGGPGLENWKGAVEKMGVRPSRIWGPVSAAGEFSGGLLTLFGFLNPLGPLNIAAMMTVAMRKAHWKWPIWNSQGGVEFPLTNFAVAIALALTGPGDLSLDGLLGTRLPRPLRLLAWLGVGAGTFIALRRPEIAETMVNKAMNITPINSVSLHVESRPAPENTPAQT